MWQKGPHPLHAHTLCSAMRPVMLNHSGRELRIHQSNLSSDFSPNDHVIVIFLASVGSVTFRMEIGTNHTLLVIIFSIDYFFFGSTSTLIVNRTSPISNQRSFGILASRICIIFNLANSTTTRLRYLLSILSTNPMSSPNFSRVSFF